MRFVDLKNIDATDLEISDFCYRVLLCNDNTRYCSILLVTICTSMILRWAQIIPKQIHMYCPDIMDSQDLSLPLYPPKPLRNSVSSVMFVIKCS